MTAAPLVVVHAGVGAPLALSDGPARAAAAAYRVLVDGGPAVDAVVGATAVLEDDPRFNAGTGAKIRIDGRIELDAGLMASDGRIGAVAALEGVRNPIRVAQSVMETPHILLAGAGATAFARRLGFRKADLRTPGTVRKWRRLVAEIRGGRLPPAHRRFQSFWSEALARSGTVGAVARDTTGAFAAANSTGGTAIMLRGRIGDTPIPGAGIYAGPHGAVACTGTGEEIIRRVVAKSVYDLLPRMSTRRACTKVLASFPRVAPVGIIAIAKSGWGFAANRPMAGALGGPGGVRKGRWLHEHGTNRRRR